MTNKKVLSTILGIFLFVFLVSSVSSTLTLGSTDPSLLPQSSSSFKINVTSNNTENISFSVPSISDYSGNKITFTSTTISINNQTKEVTISYTVDPDFEFFGKTYAATLTATGETSNESTTKTLTFKSLDFCSLNNDVLESNINSNDLKIEIEDIRVKSGLGSDGDWFPFDNVEIELSITNKNKNDDVNNIVLTWGLWDQNSGKWFIEPTEEDEFDLNNKDDTSKVISFTLNEKDLDASLEELSKADLVFYARATGDVDNDTEYTTCNSVKSSSNDIELHIDRDFVLPTELKVLNEASCGSDIEISGKLWNIGTRNQKDVSLLVSNSELKINKLVYVGDIDSFSSKKFSVLVNIPEDAKSKSYTLTLTAYDKYNETFTSKYEDVEATSSLTLNVAGNCVYSSTPKVSVSAKLQSEAIAGKDLTVKFIVSNLNQNTSTFVIDASDYENWASLTEIDKPSLTLNSGESEEVLVTLSIKEDVSGKQNFNFLVKQGDKTLSQPVVVEVSPIKESSNFLSNLFSKTKEGNSYIWVIAAVNLVLIVLIIIVAVRLSKKK